VLSQPALEQFLDGQATQSAELSFSMPFCASFQVSSSSIVGVSRARHLLDHGSPHRAHHRPPERRVGQLLGRRRNTLPNESASEPPRSGTTPWYRLLRSSALNSDGDTSGRTHELAKRVRITRRFVGNFGNPLFNEARQPL